MNRAGLAAVAVALCAMVASCASLPTSGTVPIKSLQGAESQGQPGSQVVPRKPMRTWTAVQVVRGFLTASADFAGDHAVARKYLTRGFASRWRPGWSATVVGRSEPVKVPFQGKPPVGGPPTAVKLTVNHLATLQTAGKDQAGSVVVAPASTTFTFSLVQRPNGLRISAIQENGKTAKPSLLLLTSPDFQLDYLARNIYFFPAGSPANVLVPDPVYIPQTGLLSEVRGLVSALIQPRCPKKRSASACQTNPPDSSWLYGAAVTAFPRGVRTVRPVQIVGGVTAVVDLGTTAKATSAAQRRRMAAQLAWSLTESPYGAQAGGQIKSVVLRFGDRSITASAHADWIPRAQASYLYYQVPGPPTRVMARRENAAGGSQPSVLNLPSQAGSSSFTAMAVSPVPVGKQVLAGCTGKSLYLIPYDSPQDVLTKGLPGNCSSLSWDRHGNLWIALTSGTYEMPGVGVGTPRLSALIQVQIPPVPKAKFSTLRVAPDGVRVAMIVPSGKSGKINIAAISKGTSFTYFAQTQQRMLRVGSDLAQPVALSWLDPDHLLVLDRAGKGRNLIYEVPLNGGKSTPVPTPPGVVSLSAAWPDPGKPPRLVIGVKAKDGTLRIEYSQSALINPDWQPLGGGVTPVFPG